MLLYDFGGFRLVECSYHVFTWGMMSQFCLSMNNVPFGTAQCRTLKDSGRFLVKLPRGVRVNTDLNSSCVSCSILGKRFPRLKPREL